jgi:hypothetical protein
MHETCGLRLKLSRQGKKNATNSDVRRMYLRGRSGALRLKCLPLEEVLELSKISPPTRPARVKPLSKPKKQIIVVQGVTESRQKSAMPAFARPKRKKRKSRWLVGTTSSGSALRPKSPPEATTVDRLPVRSGPAPSNLKLDQRPRLELKKVSRPRPTVTTYDGQPKFEGGIRFVQGGLPELGRR